MAIQTTWSIQWMECEKQEGSYTDVVVTAGWICQATGGGFSSSTNGTSTFTAPSGSFTPYPDLTQDQVLSWVWAGGVNKSAVEAQQTATVQSQIDSSIVSLPLPWPAN
jgi:hypothetical protein